MNKMEKQFHLSRVAFMIIDDKIYFLKNSDMSHYEWYKNLGFDEKKFNNIIRGYYKDGKIIFYKADFTYDVLTKECAIKYAKTIMNEVNDFNCDIWLGVKKGKIGEDWMPIERVIL